MMRRKNSISIAAFFLIILVLAAGQVWTKPNDKADLLELKETINTYVKIAIERNIDINLFRREVETSNAERKIAKGGFYPSISFQSRYTVAGGGREIIIDPNQFVGGLFPYDLPVSKVPFLRPHEQETKFSIIQPIFTGGALLNNYAAKSALQDSTESKLAAAEWNIKFQVTEAYLNYLQAVHLVKIKKQTLSLAREGVKISKVLFEQGKNLKNDVMRAQVNVSSAEIDLAKAIQQRSLARRFFNTLLNRDPGMDIKAIAISEKMLDVYSNLEKGIIPQTEDALSRLENIAYKSRNEIQGFEFAITAAEKYKNVAFSEYLPKLTLALDYGWQGEEYDFSSEADYYMASLVFSINLFDGGAREAKMEKAAIKISELSLRRDLLQKQIGLQVEKAYLQLLTSRKQVQAARTQLESAEENYRIVNRRYGLGMALSINMNDALTQLDGARSVMIIALYDYLIAIERMRNVLGSPYRSNKDD